MLAAAGNKRNHESVFSAGREEQMKISSGYFRIMKKRTIIKYGSCSTECACTIFLKQTGRKIKLGKRDLLELIAVVPFQFS